MTHTMKLVVLWHVRVVSLCSQSLNTIGSFLSMVLTTLSCLLIFNLVSFYLILLFHDNCIDAGPCVDFLRKCHVMINSYIFIQILEDKERRHYTQKEQLRREHRHLQRKLDQLSVGMYRVKERSISECSTSTNSTTSTSESGECFSILFVRKILSLNH